MIKQNAKRAICKSYLKLLQHEGRLHTDFTCFLCENEILEDISLVRSFMPVHSTCTYSKAFKNKKSRKNFSLKNLLFYLKMKK